MTFSAASCNSRPSIVSTQSETTTTAKSRQQAAVEVAITQELVFTPVISTVLTPCARSDNSRVGGGEAIVALLGVDDEIAFVQQCRHHLAARHAQNIMLQHILARIVRVLAAMPPGRVERDFLRIAIGRDAMKDRNAGGSCLFEQLFVGGNDAGGGVGFQRHGRNRRIEMAAMQVDRDDAGLRMFYALDHFASLQISGLNDVFSSLR